MKKQISYKIVSLVFSILVLCFAIAFYAVGWDDPTAPPAGDNVPTPLNIGDVGQRKTGALNIAGGFESEGVTLLATLGGSVGIGTVSPAQKLVVSDTGGTTLIVEATATDNNEPGIELWSNFNAAAERNWRIGTSDTVFGDFAIKQSNAKGGDPDSAGTTRLYIQNNGSVGIGTTSPQSSQDGRTIRLDVTENIVAKDIYLDNPKSGSPRWASEGGGMLVGAWAHIDSSGNKLASYNVGTVTAHGSGSYTINWVIPFSSANYAVVATANRHIAPPAGDYQTVVTITAQSAGSVTLLVGDQSWGPHNDIFRVIAIGSQ